MKSLFTQVLSLVLCLELVTMPFPKTAKAEDPPADTTSYTQAAKASHDLNETLYGKKGIVKIPLDKSGKVITNAKGEVDARGIDQSTAEAVHGDSAQKNTVNCANAIFESQKAAEFKDNKANEALAQKPANIKNENCADGCAPNEQNKILAKENTACTPEIKKQVAEVEKGDKKCDTREQVRSEAEQAWGKTSLVSKTGSCIWDFAKALFGALTKPFKDGYNAGKATFTTVRTAEEETSKRMHLLAQLPPKEVETGKKDVGAMNESIKSKFINIIASMINGLKGVDAAASGVTVGSLATVGSAGLSFFTGINLKEQYDVLQCADCTHKLEVACKLLSRIGYDLIVFEAINMAMGGTAGIYKGIGKIDAAAAKAFGAEARLAARDTAKLAETRAVKFGSKVQPVLTADAEKVVADATVPGSADNIAKQLVDKKVNLLPAAVKENETRVIVSGGADIPRRIATTEASHDALAHTSGLKLPKEPSVDTLDSVTSQSRSAIQIGSDRPPTKKMEVAIAAAKKEGIAVEDMHNATPIAFERGQLGEIKAADQEFKLNTPKYPRKAAAESPIKSVNLYKGTAEKPNFIVERENGELSFVEYKKQKDGTSMYIAKDVRGAKANAMRAVIDPVEHNEANQILLARTRANAELSGDGIKVSSVASSAEESAPKGFTAEVEGNPACPKGQSVVLGTP